MERKVSLLDTVEERGEVLQEFRQRCKQFVKTSVDLAPDTVHSHLQARFTTLNNNHHV